MKNKSFDQATWSLNFDYISELLEMRNWYWNIKDILSVCLFEKCMAKIIWKNKRVIDISCDGEYQFYGLLCYYMHENRLLWFRELQWNVFGHLQ